ncbi:Putative inner membrane protein [Salmonella enterica subsp. enterica]|nr:Putative inner membrane protein [Salmonella enterica subsp. enterica]
MVKKIITDVGETQFDRAHLLAFGQDRLTYEVVHIVNTADYNKIHGYSARDKYPYY